MKMFAAELTEPSVRVERRPDRPQGKAGRKRAEYRADTDTDSAADIDIYAGIHLHTRTAHWHGEQK